MRFLRRHPTTAGILGSLILAVAAVTLLAVHTERESAPPMTSWSSSSSTSSTTEATTTTSTTEATTTTTEPPAPTVRTTAAPWAATPAPTAPQATAAPTTRPPATTNPPPSEPCGRAMVGIRAVGLPAGFSFYCSAEKSQGHAGLTYWSSAGGSYVAINPSTGNYEGVGAHEACHAQEFVTLGASTEASADACAAAHGWPNPYAEADDTVVVRDRTLEWLQGALLVAALVLVVALLTLLPAARRRLSRKDP